MASAFWDVHLYHKLFIDYLYESKTINSKYYITLLDGVNGDIKKHPQIKIKKFT